MEEIAHYERWSKLNKSANTSLGKQAAIINDEMREIDAFLHLAVEV